MIKLTLKEIEDVENLKGIGILTDMYKKQTQNIYSEIDKEIRFRLNKLCIPFIEEEFQYLTTKEDKFKHLYHIKTKQLIISIQKVPTISFHNEGTDFIDNKITCNCELKYY